jgi:hypothetical protein
MEGPDQTIPEEPGKEKQNKEAGYNEDEYQGNHPLVEVSIVVAVECLENDSSARARVGEILRKINRFEGRIRVSRMDPGQPGSERDRLCLP